MWNWVTEAIFKNVNGGLAIGLVVGICLTTITLVGLVGVNYCPGSPCNLSLQRNEIWVPFASGPNTTSVVGPDDDPVHGERYYQRQDLRAQESVARATNSMAVIATFSLCLTLFGTVFLILTLRQTRLATVASTVATNQAIEANRLSRFSARPWIEFKFTSFGNFRIIPFGPPPYPHPYLLNMMFTPDIEFQNHGSSPAVSVRIGVRAYFGVAPSTQHLAQFLHEDTFNNLHLASEAIFSGNPVTMKGKPFGGDILPTPWNPSPDPTSTDALYLGIAVFYVDPHGELFSTFKMYVANLMRVKDNPNAVPYELRLRAEHNRYN